MILHKSDLDRDGDRLRLRHGTQGQTIQAVEATRHGDGVRLTVQRVGGETVTVELDAAEVEALRGWLAPVPHTHQEES